VTLLSVITAHANVIVATIMGYASARLQRWIDTVREDWRERRERVLAFSTDLLRTTEELAALGDDALLRRIREGPNPFDSARLFQTSRVWTDLVWLAGDRFLREPNVYLSERVPATLDRVYSRIQQRWDRVAPPADDGYPRLRAPRRLHVDAREELCLLRRDLDSLANRAQVICEHAQWLEPKGLVRGSIAWIGIRLVPWKMRVVRWELPLV
jgi:hypothetical protein